MDLTAMYTDIVFQHDKRPLHEGLREPFGAEVHHVNPTCGDEITLRVRLDDAGTAVQDVSYEASGCAMSRASASIMADLLIGQDLEEVSRIAGHMDGVMHARGKEQGDEEIIGDAVSLVGAAKFPGRVKCVLLPWKAFQAAEVEAQMLARG